MNGLELGILTRIDMKPSEICILISYDEKYEDIAKISVEKNIKNYCEIHGYSLWIDRQIEKYEGRVSQWQKIKVCLELLKKNNFKWVFFMDADSLIMNTPQKLEELIDENYSFIIPAHSMTPPDSPVINPQGTQMVITSHFFVKNNEIGTKILEDIWRAEDYPENIPLDLFDHEGRQTRITINKEEFKPHVKVVEEKTLNRFWYMNSPFMTTKNPNINDNVWEPGDFTVHVTGYPLDIRKNLLSDLNYFSGGLVSCFDRNQLKITFTPLKNLENITFVIYDVNNNALINYFFDYLDLKLYYILYIEKYMENIDLIIKSFDEKNNIIGLTILKK
jgi:hypothetical protein